jgi:hypothetical protein
MEEKLIIESTFVSFTKLLAYVEQVEVEYWMFEIDYKLEISYRIEFDDFKVIFIICG